MVEVGTAANVTVERNIIFDSRQAPFCWWMSELPPYDVTGRDAVVVARANSFWDAEEICDRLNRASQRAHRGDLE